MHSKSLSIVLPTINEAENLKELIPALFTTISPFVENLEVIVVDDGSTDNTRELLDLLSGQYSKIVGIFRQPTEKSLPNSIQAGINEASGEIVAWMDADGSMTAEVLLQLLNTWNASSNSQNSVAIASRFVKGGSVKGATRVGTLGFLQSARNLQNTEDSFLAVVLSWSLNRALFLVLGKCCRDATSGFLLGPKSLITQHQLRGVYGDYFPRLMFDLHKSGKEIIEVPYKILVRKQGISKTGSNTRQVLRSGLPYLSAFLEPFKRNQ